VRYWAAAGLLNLGAGATPVRTQERACLADAHPEVAVMAGKALCGLGESAGALPVLFRYLQEDRQLVCIAAGNVVNRIGETVRPLLDVIRTQSKASKLREGRFLLIVDWLMANALRNLGEPYEEYVGKLRRIIDHAYQGNFFP
jgi:hypothetical protein